MFTHRFELAFAKAQIRTNVNRHRKGTGNSHVVLQKQLESDFQKPARQGPITDDVIDCRSRREVQAGGRLLSTPRRTRPGLHPRPFYVL